MEQIRDFVRDRIRDLVRTSSINPSLVAAAPGEGEVARLIAAELDRLGIETLLDEVAASRFNVVGRIAGTGGGRSLLLNAHLDTVGVDGMAEPFSAAERDGRIYGRGALDMKGGAAAMLGAVRLLRDRNTALRGDLLLTFVADEEYGSLGTEALLQKTRADAVIVTEPTQLDLCVAHKGFALFEVETRGVAAHGGGYQGGVDANTHMARIAVELEKLGARLRGEKRHPLLGSPTIHVPLISGGSQLFIYASKCVMHVERRILPGESIEAIPGEIEAVVERLAAADPELEASSRLEILRRPFAAREDSELLPEVEKHASEVLGATPARIGHHWWEDSALFAEAGMDTLVIGPKGEGIHQDVEWVDVQSVVDLAKILARTAESYCNV